VDLLREVEELEFAAGVFDGGEGADQLADARAVDVADLGEVEEDVFGAFVEDFMDAVAQGDAAFAKGDAATEVEDGDSVYLADCDFHAHFDVSPYDLGGRLGRCAMFDEGEFSPRMQLAKVYLIHEGSDEKDAAAGAAQEVLRGEWVGQRGGVEAGALVADANGERVGAGLEGCGDVLGRAVGVTVEDCVDGGLSRGHDDVGNGA